MFPLNFRPQVELDVDEAYAWYEEQGLGLGEDWLLCLDETFGKISRNPEIYGKLLGDVRCAMLQRFPYNVYFDFRKAKNSVLILGVFHASRDPWHWQSRI